MPTRVPPATLTPPRNRDAITTGLGAGTFGGIEVHDVIATPDSKYAILSLRYYYDAAQATAGTTGSTVAPGIKSSGVQLYDINNKKFIGNVTSTCGSSATQCHACDPGDSKTNPCDLRHSFQVKLVQIKMF